MKDMYDTIALRLTRDKAEGVSFMEEIPPFLSDIAFHRYREDMEAVTGYLNGLRVSVTPYQIRLTEGSLCKWYLGDNLQVMSRRDTQRAIEKLSDTLHVPMKEANVTRLDIGANIITRYPCDVYFNHLGALRYSQRLQQPHSVYYQKRDGQAVFYDKIQEIRSHREEIGELYQGRNLLRYEIRYTHRLQKALNVEEVTASMLYSERFYIEALNRWASTYKAISKINDTDFNFGAMRSKKELYDLGVCALVERAGGEAAMMAKISEAQARGIYSKKQAYDIRQAIKQATAKQGDLVSKSEVISELDKKVLEAVAYYR